VGADAAGVPSACGGPLLAGLHPAVRIPTSPIKMIALMRLGYRVHAQSYLLENESAS